MQGRHKHNKYLIVQQSWAAIDNYMFRPSGGHHQVVLLKFKLIQYVRLSGQVLRSHAPLHNDHCISWISGGCEPHNYFRLHNNPPLVPILSWKKSNPSLPKRFLEDPYLYVSHLHPGLPSGLLPSGFITNTPHAPLLFPPYLPHAPFITFLFISWVILSKHYQS